MADQHGDNSDNCSAEDTDSNTDADSSEKPSCLCDQSKAERIEFPLTIEVLDEKANLLLSFRIPGLSKQKMTCCQEKALLDQSCEKFTEVTQPIAEALNLKTEFFDVLISDSELDPVKNSREYIKAPKKLPIREAIRNRTIRILAMGLHNEDKDSAAKGSSTSKSGTRAKRNVQTVKKYSPKYEPRKRQVRLTVI